MTVPPQVQAFDLPRVGARPPFLAYLAEVWRRREFIVTMAQFRIRASLEGNRLGMAWIVLRPLLNAMIYGFIFGVLQGGNRPKDYPVYVVVGVFFFEFFQGCFNDGSKAITGNRNLVQSLSFPRMTLPLAVTIERLIQFVIMLLVLVPILIAFGHYPNWDWLVIIPLVALFTLFNAGVAMITARLTVHVSDLSQLLPLLSRILFYSSGVLFSVNKIFAGHPTVIRAFEFYPLYEVLLIARHHLIGGVGYPEHAWLSLTAATLVVFVGGALFFWRAEERYGRE